MLTFLRRIRKSLINSGSARKYLLYAIGEIALVVIGILIALQVNNWSQNKESVNKEQEYLIALNNDFQQTKKLFEANRTEHEIVKSSMKEILDWAEEGGIPIKERVRFDSIFGGVFWRSHFDPPLGTVQTILSSGNLNLIRNEELASLLTQWSSLVENYRSVENEALNHFYDVIYPFISDKVNLQDMDKGIPVQVPWSHSETKAYLLLSNRKFQNMIYWHWVIQWNCEIQAEKIVDFLDRILELTTIVS